MNKWSMEQGHETANLECHEVKNHTYTLPLGQRNIIKLLEHFVCTETFQAVINVWPAHCLQCSFIHMSTDK